MTGHVRTASGLPIRHALITLLNKTTRDSVTVTSDDTGAYSAAGLAAGVYRVSAKKAGFVSLAYGQPTAYEQERSVVAGGATALQDVSFTLPRAGTIAGSVIDERGEPVADAAVGVQRFEYIGGRRQMVAALPPATTDDRGAFRLTGVPAGSFLLSAVAGGSFRDSPAAQPYAYAPTYYPSATAPDQAELIPVKEGSAVTADVRLLRTPILRLHGVVMSSSGRADRTGFVRVLAAGRADSPGKVAPVGRDGSFDVDILGLPGAYVLTAVLGVAAPADVDRRSEIARSTIHVGPAAAREVTGITMAAKPGAVVRGKVSVQGGTLSDVGPLRVFLQPTDAEEGWPPNISALVSPDGSFELRNVMWRGVVSTDLPVERPWTIAGVFLGNKEIGDVGVDPATGPVIDQLRVVIRARTEEVTGRVTDRQGRPCADATVLLFPEDPRKWTHPSGKHVVATRPDADGRFRVPATSIGRYLLGGFLSLPTGSFADPAILAALAASSKPVELMERQTPTVSLTCVLPPPAVAGSL